jgi:hypothetical protein
VDTAGNRREISSVCTFQLLTLVLTYGAVNRTVGSVTTTVVAAERLNAEERNGDTSEEVGEEADPHR